MWQDPPNLTDFTTFIQNVMGISTTYLPANSPYITYAFNNAMLIVNTDLAAAPSPFYSLAVYNLGGDNLVNFAPDQTGQTFFADLRKSLNITAFVPGVISSSSDEGTSQSLAVPEGLQNLSLLDLQNLKTPWGRQYLAYAQMYGPLWGLS